jgi:hypothetical protein
MAELNYSNIVSPITLSSTMAKREHLRKLVDVQDSEWTMFDWIDFTDRAFRTDNVEYSHAVNSSLYASATVHADVAAGSAGVTTSITCTGALSTKPLVGEVILFPNGVNGYISAVSAATNFVLTVKFDSADSCPALTATTSKLIFPTNAQGEGAAMSAIMRTSPITKRYNYIQKFSTKIQQTDLAGATMIEMDYKGQPYAFYKEEYEAYIKHRLDIANAGFIGTRSNSMTDVDGNVIYKTNGLRPSIINGGGVNFTTAGSGVFDILVDYKALNQQMNVLRCPSEYTLWAAQSLHDAIDTNLASNSAFTGGGINYGAYNGDSTLALKFGAKSLTAFGRTTHIHRFKAAEHSGLYGVSGYGTFLKEGYMIPVQKIKAHASGEMIDRIRARYMTYLNNKDLRYLKTEEGALAPNPTSNEMKYKLTINSNHGFEFVGTEQFARVILQ